MNAWDAFPLLPSVVGLLTGLCGYGSIRLFAYLWKTRD